MWFPKLPGYFARHTWSRLCRRLNPVQVAHRWSARRRRFVPGAGRQVEELEPRVVLASDFGDAPLPYPTSISENGAQHTTVGPTLGSNRDSEANGTHSVNAGGDDTTGVPDDEDGVTFGTLQVGALGASTTVNVQGAPAGAKLNAWIDFNADGFWGGPGEQIAGNISVVNGANAVTFDIPSWAIDGTTFARFRLSTSGNLGPEGSAANGEVEDYAVTLLAPAATSGHFATEQIISSAADTTYGVVAADLDGDGDIDLVSAESERVSWYENNGQQIFMAHAISTSVVRAEAVFAVDLDDDGDLDVLTASSGDSTIAWYENQGDGVFGSHTISTAALQPLSVFAADVEGDGDIDVLSASRDNQIIWYRNNGSQGFTSITINNLSYGAAAVFAADVDSDGDMDVVTASSFDNTIAWLENDGSQNFAFRAISTEAAGAFGVFATDVDHDGDIDVISASPEDNTVAWFENDGTQQFVKHVISTTSVGVFGLFAADVDGDGDVDILSASAFDNTVAWFENDGNRNFASHKISTSAAEAGSVVATDLDGDGDLDVVAAAAADNKLAWYENANRVTLSVSATSGSEVGTTVITVTATAEHAVNALRTVDLNVTGIGITAADYSLSAPLITIPLGQLTGSVTFTVVNDAVVEGTETATLTLANPAPGLNLGESITHSITIADDDSSTLTIANGAVDEGNSGTQVLTFEVRSTNAVAGGFTVTFSFANITANGSDYAPVTSSPITFLGTVDEIQTITVNVSGDIELEGTETFTVTLGAVTPLTPGASLNVATGATATGVIFDDEIPTVSIENIHDGVEQNVPTNGLVRVRQSAVTNVDTVVNYIVLGTAISGAGNDYATLSGTVTIPAGQASVDIPVLVFNDSFVEGTETVRVMVTSLGTHDSAVILDADPARLIAETQIIDTDAPTIPTIAPANLVENTLASTSIVDVDAVVLPGSVSLTYGLSGPDAGVFRIDLLTGQIYFLQDPDFESPADFDHNNIFQVTVTATADVIPARSTSQMLTITVTGANDNAPVIVSIPTASAPENSPIATLILDVNATDADLPGQALSYTLSGPDAELFAINTSGHITFRASPDYEAPGDENGDNIYTLTVTVTDDGPSPNSSSQPLAIAVSPLNDNTPTISSVPTATVPENAPNSTVILDVNALDADQSAQTLSYALSGPDAGLFNINGTGEITFRDSPDFESPADLHGVNVYHLTVTVSDNGATPLSISQDLTVTVTGVNDESPIFTTASPTYSLPENSGQGTEVGIVEATDLDQPQQALSYSIIGGNINGGFAIHPTTGHITVANPAALDFEITPEFTLTIMATDDGVQPRSATVLVSVFLTNTNEAPQLNLGEPEVTWISKRPPVTVLPSVTVVGGTSQAGGTLTINVNAIGSAKKLLDQFHIPSFSGLGSSSGPQFVNGQLNLQIQLGANATNAAIQAFLRGITFATKGKGLKALTRTLNVTLSAGGQSSAVSQTINVRKKA